MIGITECGDPSIDYSWVDKIDSMDMVIIVTKNLTKRLCDEILKYKNKILLHVTCTGYGGTILEPKIPTYKQQIDAVRELEKLGFPHNQIVIRIDPIIPTKKGIENFRSVVDYAISDFKRFRVSVLDNYKHVQTRFIAAKLPILYGGNFQATDEQFKMLDNEIKYYSRSFNATFESCAETRLPSTVSLGCVNANDIKLFGISQDGIGFKGSRKGCLCIADKTELLKHQIGVECKLHYDKIDNENENLCTEGHNCKKCKLAEKYGCPYKCLYCYWKS